jgi:hypothetical protein
MALIERVHLPSFAGATGCLNSEPLGPADLRGHVVLVNFWTWTCINSLRQEPAWPKPRRRTDVWGFNSTWWMAPGWLLLIVLAISPWPWW